MEHRSLNEAYERIAQDLIENEPALAYIKDSPVRIAYLGSDQKKTKDGGLVHGECEKVQAKNRWAINYDFTITIFYNNCVEFDEGRMRILMFHELLHVGIDLGPEGDYAYHVKDHDLVDFKEIVERFGVDWDKAPAELKN